MDFEKVERAIEKSTDKAKEMLFSEEIGKFLDKLAEENNLDEKITLKFIDEVGYVILGIKGRSTLKKSLYDLGIEQGAVLAMIQEINRKIFTELDKVEIEMEKEIEQPTHSDTPETLETQIKTPSAPLTPNLPMIEEGEVAHDAPPVEAQASTPSPSVSINEVKPEKPKVEVSTPNYTYQKGQDPYREPLQ